MSNDNVSHKITRDEMRLIASETFESCAELMSKCQEDYARDTGNAHANFDRLANDLNLRSEEILWVFIKKHLDAILSWIEGTYSGREAISGRIFDAINYLVLLNGMVRRGHLSAVAAANEAAGLEAHCDRPRSFRLLSMKPGYPKPPEMDLDA